MRAPHRKPPPNGVGGGESGLDQLQATRSLNPAKPPVKIDDDTPRPFVLELIDGLAFMDRWHVELQSRLRRAELLVSYGLPDDSFAALAEEVHEFNLAVLDLATALGGRS